jgi:hypothetical protein
MTAHLINRDGNDYPWLGMDSSIDKPDQNFSITIWSQKKFKNITIWIQVEHKTIDKALNIQYNKDCTDNWTMETDWARHRIVDSSQRPRRPSGNRSSRCSQRHLMDLAHRHAMERLAPAVPAAPDMPMAIPAIGPESGFSAHYYGAGLRPKWTW